MSGPGLGGPHPRWDVATAVNTGGAGGGVVAPVQPGGGPLPSADELVLPYELGPSQQRVTLRFRLLLTRCLFTLISGAIMVGLWLYNTRVRGVRDYFSEPLVVGMYLTYASITLLTLGVAIGRWLLERRRLARVSGRQVACRVDRTGMALGDLQLTWAQVDGLQATTPWWSGLARYELTGLERRERLLTDQLPLAPSGLANAVAVLSADQIRMDTRRLDR